MWIILVVLVMFFFPWVLPLVIALAVLAKLSDWLLLPKAGGADKWIRILDGLDPLPDADLLKKSPAEVSQLSPISQQRYAQLTRDAPVAGPQDKRLRILHGFNPVPDADLLKMPPDEVSQLFPISQQRYAQLTQPIAAAKLPKRRHITPAKWAKILDGLDPLPDAELLRVPPAQIHRLLPINQQRLLQLRQSAAAPAPASAPAQSATAAAPTATRAEWIFIGLLAAFVLFIVVTALRIVN